LSERPSLDLEIYFCKTDDSAHCSGFVPSQETPFNCWALKHMFAVCHNVGHFGLNMETGLICTTWRKIAYSISHSLTQVIWCPESKAFASAYSLPAYQIHLLWEKSNLPENRLEDNCSADHKH